MENEYDYKSMDSVGDLISYKEAFDSNESKKNIEQLDWVHFKNIPKEQLVSFAKKESQVAAIYAAMPVFFKLKDNKRVLACQSLDTITDKNHRGKGLFITLAKDVYSKAKNKNCHFVYGFPNGSSVHGFTKKLNWKLHDPVPFLVKPMRLGYFLSKIPVVKAASKVLNFPLSIGNKPRLSNKQQIKSITSFGAEYDALWSRFSQNIAVCINRDANYMNWRFVDKPLENYCRYAIYDGEALKGIVVYCLKAKHGGNIGYIMELVCENDYYGKKLLFYALSHLKKEKVDACLTWCFDHSPNRKAFEKSLFLKLPKKLQNIELHFGFACFNEEANSLLSEKENWYISYADSDTV
jgi:Acetyltransferase (GNAT) domain